MDSMKVRDLMIPVKEYVTIDENATLFEAVTHLEDAHMQFEAKRVPHTTLLVRNKSGKIIGILSEMDVLRSLEPRYNQIDDLKNVSGFGLSAEFMRSMMTKYDLWKAPLDDLCRKAADHNVKDLISAPADADFVEADASLNQAAHQLIVGCRQMLLVTSGQEIIGVIRLSEIFNEIVEKLKACKI